MELLQLLAQFLERQDLLSKLTESERLHGYGYSEVHAIAAIAAIDHANVTKIAAHLHMTRGAVSKIAKRLRHSGCITPYTEPGNKKEVYYHLTEKGAALCAEHDARHRQWQQRDQAFLRRCDQRQLQAVTRFMRDYNAYLQEQIQQLGGR